MGGHAHATSIPNANPKPFDAPRHRCLRVDSSPRSGQSLSQLVFSRPPRGRPPKAAPSPVLRTIHQVGPQRSFAPRIGSLRRSDPPFPPERTCSGPGRHVPSQRAGGTLSARTKSGHDGPRRICPRGSRAKGKRSSVAEPIRFYFEATNGKAIVGQASSLPNAGQTPPPQRARTL